MKTCTNCKQTKSLSEYYRHYNSKDGYRYICKTCCSAYQRKYRQTEKGKALVHKLKKLYHLRCPEKRKARQATRDAIRTGKIPRPEAFICANKDCLKQAEQYHHDSYEPEQRLAVTPLCEECHIKL